MPYFKNLKVSRSKLKDQNNNTVMSDESHVDAILKDLELLLTTGNFTEQAYLLDALPQLLNGGDNDYKNFWTKAEKLYSTQPRQVDPEFHRSHFIPFLVDVSAAYTVTNAHHVYLFNLASDNFVNLSGQGVQAGEKFTFYNTSVSVATLRTINGSVIGSLPRGKVEVVASRENPQIGADWSIIPFHDVVYYEGTSYLNGTPLLTCPTAGFVVNYGAFVVYQPNDGTWRMKCHAHLTFGATTGTILLTFSGLVFKTTIQQAVSISAGVESYATIAGAGTADVTVSLPVSVSQVSIFFDAELDEKPTWAI